MNYRYINRVDNKTGLKCIILGLVLLVSACSEHKQIESDLKDYAERLESFTEITIEPANIELALNAPQKKSLEREIEQVFINLREFYAFNSCALNQIVAQRNTALGKMQLPSSRFIYEYQLLDEFTRCRSLLEQELQALDENNESARNKTENLISNLDSWQNTKREQFPSVWSNFITQSNEIYLSLSQSQDFIAAAPSDNFQGTRQAWQFLADSHAMQFDASDEQRPITAAELENHLKELDTSRLLARMWRTQLLIGQGLDSISPLLETYLARNTCESANDEDEIKIMQNIFKIFFADKIQPLAAELNRYHYDLAPLLNKVSDSGNLPSDFSDYVRYHAVSNHEKYSASMRNHIQLWQDIFARCN
jgi:hypothetical protein